MSRPGPRARGYTKRWEKARETYLSRGNNRFCRMCAAEGKKTIATHVDHIKSAREHPELVWNSNNWQPLCDHHHNRDKQQIERRGYRDAVGPDGIPTDPAHPFNRDAR